MVKFWAATNARIIAFFVYSWPTPTRFLENYFIKFYRLQDEKVKEKIQYVLELIKQVDRVPEKFLKHLTGTDGLYEIRIEYRSDIFRIFCCFDEGRLVVLFNGFQKKSQKTPQNEMDKALGLMKEYFKDKKTEHERL